MHTLFSTHINQTAGRTAKPFQHHFLLLLQMPRQYYKGCDKTLMNTNPSSSTCMSVKCRKYFNAVNQLQVK